MTLALPTDVTTTEVEDGMVLLDRRKGRYWQLNRTGALTLRLLLDGHSPEQTAARLSESCQEGAERAHADVAALIAALHAAGLLEGS